MAVKIRLQRRGKKKSPFYHLVVVDSKTKRDGKYVEQIGTYDPITNPATITIDFDKALYWLGVGAQPTETAKAILSYKGVLIKKHLSKGVTKGSLTQEQADAKFEKWLQEKEEKIQSKRKRIIKTQSEEEKQKLEQEAKVKEKIAKKVTAKTASLAEEVKENKTIEERNEITASEEVTAEQENTPTE